jgi:thymidylate synthase (FAD)
MPDDAAIEDPRRPDPASLATRSDILGDGDRSWVELQDMMPYPTEAVTPDVSIVNAARVSFLGHSKGDDQDRRLLFYLLSHRHTSPFEQVEFKFRVRAPVIVWWQWVRHRTWHYNLQSGRYLPFEDDDFYIPRGWRKQSESNKQGSEGLLDAPDAQTLHDRLAQHVDTSYEMYRTALEMGVAKEQARLFLPAWASYYIAVCKVDAWNLMHFLWLRMADDAQWEIRQYAHAIHSIFREVMPWTAEAFDRYIRPEGVDAA